MAPSGKNATGSKDRRKSGNNNTAATAASSTAVAASTGTGSNGASPGKHVVVLKVAPASLRAIVDPASVVKEETPVKDDKSKDSPAESATLATAPNSNNTENASDSTPDTPAAGTPAPQATAMGPPTEGPKKKGTKRAASAVNGEPKVRGKPGPKKKQRLEDGTVDGGRGGALGMHKLGPKANQGAINAGLRALDRSGKPCRKWNKGNFVLKSFTGVVWEIPRWSAPPKPKPEVTPQESVPASAEGSSKENKENNSQIKSEASNNGVDVEMQSAPSLPAANSPAPVAIAAA